MVFEIQYLEDKADETLLRNDYQNAILSVLWFGDNIAKKDYIVFATVELFTDDYPLLSEIQKVSYPNSSTTKQYLYFERKHITVNEAIDWYKKIALENKVDKIFGDKNSCITPLKYKVEIPFPKLLIENASLLSHNSNGMYRFSSIYTLESLQEMNNMLLESQTREWISKYIKYDLAKYQESIGSIHLIAHNPIIRNANSSLIVNDDGNENVLIKIELQSNKTTDGLHLLFVDKQHHGFSSFRCEEITSTAILIKNVGEFFKTAFAIFDKKRGIIFYHDFYPFLKSIRMNMSIGNKKKQIVMLDGTERVIDEYIKDRESIIGDNSDNVLSKQFLSSENTRQKKQHAAELNQQIFYDNKTEAIDFIRSLIQKAHRDVYFIDPYFYSKELFNFGFDTKYAGVKVKILTSRFDDEKLSLLKKNLNHIKHKGYDIDVHVMTGKPIFHDRFIKIDDNVWCSGNSFNSLAERLSFFIKMPYPNEFIDLLTKIINGGRVKKLEDISFSKLTWYKKLWTFLRGKKYA